MKKNPGERYPSVTALGEDLRRFLKREPIRARPDTLLYRASKFVGRNRVAVAGVTLASVALIVTAIIVVNNLRDIDTDRAAHKHTLAVLLGRRATRAEYLLLIAGAYLLLPLGPLLGLTSAWALLPWLTLPLALPLIRAMYTEQGRSLNRALAGTGRLHLVFGVLFAAGLSVGTGAA